MGLGLGLEFKPIIIKFKRGSSFHFYIGPNLKVCGPPPWQRVSLHNFVEFKNRKEKGLMLLCENDGPIFIQIQHGPKCEKEEEAKVSTSWETDLLLPAVSSISQIQRWNSLPPPRAKPPPHPPDSSLKVSSLELTSTISVCSVAPCPISLHVNGKANAVRHDPGDHQSLQFSAYASIREVIFNVKHNLEGKVCFKGLAGAKRYLEDQSQQDTVLGGIEVQWVGGEKGKTTSVIAWDMSWRIWVENLSSVTIPPIKCRVQRWVYTRLMQNCSALKSVQSVTLFLQLARVQPSLIHILSTTLRTRFVSLGVVLLGNVARTQKVKKGLEERPTGSCRELVSEGSGANGAIIHYRAEPDSCSIVDANKLFLLDSGAQYIDGTTDITRTVHFGEPTVREKDCFTRVLQGHIALDQAVFPENTPGFVLDAFARSSLWKAGLDYRHGTGHGVGAALNVHEGPQSISFRFGNLTPLQEGMIVSNEPGYYEDHAFGIRIENLLCVKEIETPNRYGGIQYLGFEKLTYVPIQRKLVDLSLLSNAELDWLNDYHTQVWEKVSPLVAGSAREWLWENTRPLEKP